MAFIRIALIVLIIILLARLFSGGFSSKAYKENETSKKRDREKGRKVADKTGEYVDYEEIEK